MTWLDEISKIQTSLNQITKDQWMSRKYIYSLIISEFYALVRQKTNWQNILSNSDIIKYECLEMDNKINTCSDCLDYGALKSTKSISALNTMKGDGIISVTNKQGKTYQRLDSLFNLKKSTERRFSRSGSYVFNQGYIYIGGSSPSSIIVWYIPELNDLSGAKSCGLLQTKCSIPSDLMQAISKSIMNNALTSLRIPIDEKPNLDVNDK